MVTCTGTPGMNPERKWRHNYQKILFWLRVFIWNSFGPFLVFWQCHYFLEMCGFSRQQQQQQQQHEWTWKRNECWSLFCLFYVLISSRRPKQCKCLKINRMRTWLLWLRPINWFLSSKTSKEISYWHSLHTSQFRKQLLAFYSTDQTVFLIPWKIITLHQQLAWFIFCGKRIYHCLNQSLPFLAVEENGMFSSE